MDYSEDFLSFLEDESKVRPEKSRLIKNESIDKDIVRNVNIIWRDVENELYRRAKPCMIECLRKCEPLSFDVINTVKNIIDERKSWEISNSGGVPKRLRNRTEKGLRRLYSLDDNLERLSYMSDLVSPEPYLNDILEIATYMLDSKEYLENTAGMIFVGFGEDEIYPSCIEYAVDGIFFNGLKSKMISETYVTEEKRGIIKTFAQNDVSETFLNGMEPELFYAIFNGFESMLNTMTLSLAEPEIASGVTTRDALISANKAALKEHAKEMLSIARSKYFWPIEDSMAFMSKTELSQVAESLVNMTSLRRRAAISDDESVGGPVDVAVISRGEGMIWINRKHYFDAKFNPQYNGRR